ncbi:BTAD domain-containing putative transcriptional regulator [Lentzea sp. NBRC 105346]|uniref:AfsR/SARP family transcriptional regulator n=1 Tax=Lentzea sp. NBRC 105346 TaxID=3032205 RepID=UPI0025531C6E|nr:BTAD domain-containing putative transcriptional regulator [Lentzea sp. NBRC 105346]
MLIEIKMLGQFETIVDGDLVRIGSASQKALLCTLALSGEVVSMDQLAYALWGDTPPTTYRQQIPKRIFELRQVLGEWAITTSDDGYQLDLTECDIDVLRYHDLRQDARTAVTDGRPRDAVAAFRDALALWRGPALDGVPGELIGDFAAELDESRLATVEECVDLELALGRHAELVPELRRLAAMNPTRERLVEQLMTALHRTGQQAEAMEVFEQARARLSGDYSVTPSERLEQVFEAVRDNTFPVTVPAGLPRSIPTFTGRAEQLEALDQALADAATNVVLSSIGGAGGVGKTALALHWAHRKRSSFPDGQLYVDLRGFDRGEPVLPDQALVSLLQELGVSGDRIPTSLQARTSLLRSMLANKRMLVLLDNARDAEQVIPLLPGTPGCLVVITSRNTLSSLVAVHDARPISLDVMSTPESLALLENVLGPERLDGEPAAELANLCGNLPLALRIAAATLITHPRMRIAELVETLRTDRLGVLDVDPAASVRTTFDLSYRVLPEDSQRVLRLLGTAPGDDISFDAVAALADSADVRGPLARLEEAHLVEQYLSGRYRLHDLVKLCAAELPEPGRDEAAGRLVRWYVSATDAAVTSLMPTFFREPRPFSVAAKAFPDRPAALSWLRAERRNLVGAVHWTFDHGHDALCGHLVDALRGFFWIDHTVSDWVDTGELGLTAARRIGDQRLQSAAHRSLGIAYAAASDMDQARAHYGRATTMFEQLGAADAAANARVNFAVSFVFDAPADQIAESFAAAESASLSGADEGMRVSYLANLSFFETLRGRFRAAIEVATEAVGAAEAIGSTTQAVVARGARVEAFTELGDLVAAQEECALAIEASRSAGLDTFVHIGRVNLARIQLAAGMTAEPLELCDAAIAFADRCHHLDIWCSAMVSRANAHLLDHAPDRALADLEAVLPRANRWYTMETLICLAAAHVVRTDAGAAMDAASRALALCDEYGWHRYSGRAQYYLARAHALSSRTVEAVSHAERALARHRSSGQRLQEARDLALIATLTDTPCDVTGLVSAAAGELTPGVLTTLTT